MGRLTEIQGDFPAEDAEIEAALESAADDLNMDPDQLEEEVAHILDTGTGKVTNEAIGGPTHVDNPDAESDPRLEALELYKLRNEL